MGVFAYFAYLSREVLSMFSTLVADADAAVLLPVKTVNPTLLSRDGSQLKSSGYTLIDLPRNHWGNPCNHHIVARRTRISRLWERPQIYLYVRHAPSHRPASLTGTQPTTRFSRERDPSSPGRPHGLTTQLKRTKQPKITTSNIHETCANLRTPHLSLTRFFEFMITTPP